MDLDPVALAVGSISVRWLGIFWLLGSAATIAWWWRDARLLGIDASEAATVISWVVPAAVLGARLFHVLSSAEHYVLQPADALGARAGLALWGAIACGGLAGTVAARRRGLPRARLLDAAAPGLALGEAVGRIGCLIDGLNLGPPTDLPWAVRYAHPDAQAPDAEFARHPTPAYHMLAALGLFAALLALRRRPLAPGAVFMAWLAIHAATRLALGGLRVEPTIGLGLQVSQWWAVVALAGLLFGIIRRRRTVQAAHSP